jgi:predicted MPP superfamily phosphohydrolase
MEHDLPRGQLPGPPLDQRLGRQHLRQREGIERDHEARILARQRRGFRLVRPGTIRAFVRGSLWLAGLRARARQNAATLVVRDNEVWSPRLPPRFDGYTVLHLSDLHADISLDAMRHLTELVRGVRYDLCVLTGDYRGRTFGSCAASMELMAGLRGYLTGPLYGVLGNHDSVTMLPGLEAMGIRMLMNECASITRDGETIWLAGVDDAHFFRLENVEKAAEALPADAFAILLSHTPEIYQKAAHAGFDLMLSGHTHGGQICLPGSIPVIIGTPVPRRMAAGAWRYHGMSAYTSVGVGTSMLPARLNCPPEITLHHLRRG